MWLIIMIIAVFLATMIWAIILQFKPNALKITEKFVCRKDEKMEILTSVASYHKPGERSISIYCNNYGKQRSVKLKVLLLSFLVSFFLMLPPAYFIVNFASNYLGKFYRQ